MGDRAPPVHPGGRPGDPRSRRRGPPADQRPVDVDLPEPDVVDLAHAAELLNAQTADPDLVMGLATKVRVRGPRHLDRCFDGAKLDCSCGLGNEEPF